MAKRASKRNPADAPPQSQRLRAVAGFLAESESGDGERLVYERIRLGIMSALSVNRSMSFSELRDLLQTTDGNLSRHARKLEDAGYIACKKAFSDRVPKTEFSLTAKGRRMFERHLEHMESLIKATRGE